jgi:hypothetical protein
LERGPSSAEGFAGAYEGVQRPSQLIRFKQSPDPILYIGTYLYHIYLEGVRRGYRFDAGKILVYDLGVEKLSVKEGQLKYEFTHLLNKLRWRNLEKYRELVSVKHVEPHPLFKAVPGGIEEWERLPPKKRLPED